MQLKKIENEDSLSKKLSEVDKEFKNFMSGLVFRREGPEQLKTFSPLDAVADFEQRGLNAIAEVSRDEMMKNDNAFNKLLANIFAECQPGTLSDEDLIQITGINGREVQTGV